MNYKILERYMGITKEDFLEIKKAGDCPHSIWLVEEFVRHIEGIRAENREGEADDFLTKL